MTPIYVIIDLCIHRDPSLTTHCMCELPNGCWDTGQVEETWSGEFILFSRNVMVQSTVNIILIVQGIVHLNFIKF